MLGAVGTVASLVAVSVPALPALPAASVKVTEAVNVSSSSDETSIPVKLIVPSPATEPVPVIAVVLPFVSSIE